MTLYSNNNIDHGKIARERQKAQIEATIRRLKKLREDSEKLKMDLTVFGDESTLDSLLTFHEHMLRVERSFDMTSFDIRKFKRIKESLESIAQLGEFPPMSEQFRNTYSTMWEYYSLIKQCVTGDAGNFEKKLSYAQGKIISYSKRYKAPLAEFVTVRRKKMMDLIMQLHRHMLDVEECLESDISNSDKVYLMREKVKSVLDIKGNISDMRMRKTYEDIIGYASRIMDFVAGV